MEIINSISSTRENLNHCRTFGRVNGLVPTMVALHHKHISLVEVTVTGLDSITEDYLTEVNLKDLQCAETVNGEDQLALRFVEYICLIDKGDTKLTTWH